MLTIKFLFVLLFYEMVLFVVHFSVNSCVIPSVIMIGIGLTVVHPAAFMFLKTFALNENWILSNL